jgi:hypothetical protein
MSVINKMKLNGIKVACILSLLVIPVVAYAQAIQDVAIKMFAPYDNTTDMNSTDTSQLFTTAFNTAHAAHYGSGLTTAQWNKVKAVWITCENADVRIAFGTAAVQGTSTTSRGHVLASGQSLRLTDNSRIRAMRFISKTASTPGRLQVSLEY